MGREGTAGPRSGARHAINAVGLQAIVVPSAPRLPHARMLARTAGTTNSVQLLYECRSRIRSTPDVYVPSISGKSAFQVRFRSRQVETGASTQGNSDAPALGMSAARSLGLAELHPLSASKSQGPPHINGVYADVSTSGAFHARSILLDRFGGHDALGLLTKPQATAFAAARPRAKTRASLRCPTA